VVAAKGIDLDAAAMVEFPNAHVTALDTRQDRLDFAQDTAPYSPRCRTSSPAG